MNYISYSIFGNEPRYWKCLPMNISMWKTLFPDFTIVYSTTESSKQFEWFNFLKDCEELKLVKIDVKPDMEKTLPTLYRYDMLWDYPDANIVLSRDVDAIINTREYAAINHFINSRFNFYSFRSFHLHTTLLMAGMCGFKAQWVKDNVKKSGITNREWGCDQTFLGQTFGSYSCHMAEYLGQMCGKPFAGNCVKDYYQNLNKDLLNNETRKILIFGDAFLENNRWDATFKGFECMPFCFGDSYVRDMLSISDSKISGTITGLINKKYSNLWQTKQ